MTRALVVGGTRFIGRSLVEELLRRGGSATLLHLGHQNPFGGRVEEILCDRTDHAAVRRGLAGKRFDVVFDNAYVHPQGTTAADVACVVETLDTPGLRVVFTSSVAVYPVDVGHSLDEASPLASRPDPYCLHKVESERWLFGSGARATAVRPTFVVGPHNRGYQLSFFWDRLAAGRPILVPGDGSTPIQLGYVHDVARVLADCAASEATVGEAVNVGWDRVLSQLELIELLAHTAGMRARVAFVPRAVIAAAGGTPFDSPLYFGESLDIPSAVGVITTTMDKARRLLAFEATPWDDALAETYRWYREERAASPPQDYRFEDALIAQATRRPRGAGRPLAGTPR